MKTILFTLLLVNTTLMAFSTTIKKTAVIRLIAPAGYYSETTVYFDYAVVPAFVNNEDAPEVYSNFPGAPSIYSFTTDNVLCSINGYSPLSTSAFVQLGIKIETPGAYTFNQSLLTNFDSSTIIQLEDRQLNIFINLRNNFYQVQLSDTGVINGRFFLHVSSPVQTLTVSSDCANNSGAIKLYADSSLVWTAANLYDSAGSQINYFNNIAGNFTFGNLSEGDYRLVLFFAGNYISTIPVHVNGNYVVAQIQTMPLSPIVNQEITFHAMASNATNFLWSFGDSSQINGINNPTFNYEWAGVFKVVLICSNDSGCQGRDSVTITVTEPSSVNTISAETRNIWAYSKTVTATLEEEITPGAELKIYNRLGQPVYDAPVNNITTTVTLNEQPNGYYIVTLLNKGITSTKQVVLVK